MAVKRPKSKNLNPRRVYGKNGVFYTFSEGDPGQIQLKIDFSLVPPPEAYYYADSLYLRMDKEQHMVILSFGHRNENADTFSNRIDIVMPIKALMGPFWASTRPVESTLDKLLEAYGPVEKNRPIGLPDNEAATLFANMIFVAVGDGESTLDFYHLPPREVHLAKTERKDIELQPTIRVIMSSVLTKHFFNALRPHAELAVDSAPVLERSHRAARPR